LYAFTSDKRILLGPDWKDITDGVQFDRPPLLAICGKVMLAADHSKLYFRKTRTDYPPFEWIPWTETANPVEGEIRAIVRCWPIFVIGESKIILSDDTTLWKEIETGQPWKKFWDGGSVQSNLAFGQTRYPDSTSSRLQGDFLIAAEGKVWASSCREYEWVCSDWVDISGELRGKPVHFLAVGKGARGADGVSGGQTVFAATNNQVYRLDPGKVRNLTQTGFTPLWNSFEKGLPSDFQVRGLWGNSFFGSFGVSGDLLGDVVLSTDRGGFVYSGGEQWQKFELGNPLIYIHQAQDGIAPFEHDYVVTDKGIWTRTPHHCAEIECAGESLLEISKYVCLFPLSVVCGIVFARWTSRRLAAG
jgi:hypothetical protein